jgi:hypothetical protein
MAEKLFFLHEDPSTAAVIAAPLASRGYAIEISSVREPDVEDAIADANPLAVVISLQSDAECDASREIAAEVLADARMARPLLVFVGGTAEQVAETRAALPYGLYVRPDEVAWTLKHLQANS